MTPDIARASGTVLRVRPLSPEMLILATSTLSRYLAISKAQAEDELRKGVITLNPAVDPKTEDQLFAVLGALGIIRQKSRVQGDQFLSVQLAARADLAHLAPRLAMIFELPLPAVQMALQRPGGMILENLTADRASQLRKLIRRVQGLKTAQSDMNAVCDLFVIKPLPASVSRQLGRYLALMGATPCRFSGAVAQGLTVHQAGQICARFPQSVLIGLDRAFQRFDLFLTGIGDLAPQDVAEFLSTRTNLSGAMVECVTRLQPLQIENCLTRGVTRQFRADYAAIGLETSARLTSC